MKNGIISKLILLSLFSITSFNLFCKLGDTWHFDAETLRNSQETKRRLIEEDGFVEVTFNPIGSEGQKNTELKGLFLERPNARATIIFTPGFCPGKKEPFAPFVKLAPQDCNLLFTELQGHGENGSKSSCPFSCLKGGFLKELKTYGLNQHEDIIGAISHIAELTQRKPIILFGWCAGAYLSAKTLIKLKEFSPENQNLIKELNIKGLIFESGFAKPSDAVEGLYHEKNRILDKKRAKEKEKKEKTEETESEKKESGFVNSIIGGIASIYAKGKILQSKVTRKIGTLLGLNEGEMDQEMDEEDYKDMQEMIKEGAQEKLSNWAKTITETKNQIGEKISDAKSTVIKNATGLLMKVAECFIGNSMKKNEPETNITNKINQLEDLPIFVIHHEWDNLAKWEDTEKLVENMQNKDIWLVKETEDSTKDESKQFHVKNHLKHKDEYQEKLGEWLDKVVPKKVETKKEEQKKHNIKTIERMIEIAKKVIEIIDNTTENSEQEAKDLFAEFEELLNNPNSNIPQEAKDKIIVKYNELQNCKNKENIKKILEEIIEILEQILNGLDSKKTKSQKSNANKPKDEQKNNQQAFLNNPNSGRSKRKSNIYDTNPAKKPVVASATPKAKNSKPSSEGASGSGRSYSPSNYNGSGTGSHYPTNCNNNSDQQPYYNAGGPNYGNGGRGDTNWPSNNTSSQRNNTQNKSNSNENSHEITVGEIERMDDQSDPKMADRPDPKGNSANKAISRFA